MIPSTMILIDGKKVAAERKAILKEKFAALPIQPTLAVIQVGTIPESTVYINRKIAFAKSIGLEAGIINVPNDVTEESLISEIQALNDDHVVGGIILQLPIPEHLDRERIITAINPKKDIDGLTARNMWRLMDADPSLVPATAFGIHTLLEEYDIEVKGKHIVIVGDSLLVGKSTALYFLYHDATVTVCHDETKQLEQHTKQADILISAVGQPGLITKDHVKEGQVVIDVGITRQGNRVVGDVAFEEVSEIVRAITPVPGGVGPLTVVSLFENMLTAIESR